MVATYGCQRRTSNNGMTETVSLLTSLNAAQHWGGLTSHLLKHVWNFAAGGGHSSLWPEVTTFLSHRVAYSGPEAGTYKSQVPAKHGTDGHTTY